MPNRKIFVKWHCHGVRPYAPTGSMRIDDDDDCHGVQHHNISILTLASITGSNSDHWL